MTIYRGPGGTGTATSDADTSEFQEFLTQSQAARDAALVAETAAELAETNAETAAASASASASAASTSATNASNSATAASSSAASAAASASEAVATLASTVKLTGDQTIAGTKTLSSNPVLSGGTANGVAYLNGSKVLTTGSALTFDGTNFIVGSTQRLLVGKTTSDANNFGIQSTGASAYTNGLQLTYSGVGASALWVPAASSLAFGADGASGTTELMRLTSTGLGIGTSSPGYKLDVRGGVIAAGNGTIVGGISYSTRPEIGAISNHSVGFITNNTTQMLLDTSGNLSVNGNLGLGTSTATTRAKLDISNPITTSMQTTSLHLGYSEADFYGFRVVNENNPSQTAAGNFKVQRGTTTQWLDSLVVDNTGNLLVGTTTVADPNGAQIVNAYTFPKTGSEFRSSSTSAHYAFTFRNPNGVVGSITTAASSTSYNTTSDYRLKNVFGAVSGSGERIDALEPVEYEWKTDGTRTRGFLAHKFQEVYAGSVTGSKDAVDKEGKPVYQTMQASSSEVIADLVAEIQSLRKRLAAAGI